MKKRIFKTLKGKFFLITITLMLTFGIGAATLSYIMFSDNLRSNSIHAAETNLQFMRNEINGNLESILELSQWSRTNTEIVNYISSGAESSNYAAVTRQATERLTEEYISNSAYQYISRIIITNSEGSKFLQKFSSSSYSVDRNVIDIIKSLPYFDEVMGASGYTFSIGVQKDPFARRPEEMIPLIRPIESLYSSDTIGISYIQISFSMFTDPLMTYSHQQDTPVYLTIGAESYRIENGDVTSVKQREDGKNLSKGDLVSADTLVQEINSDGKSVIYVTTPLRAEGCYISMPVDTASQGNSSVGYFSILLVILIFITVIGLLLIRLLSHNVTRPVAMIKRQIDSIAQGDFSQDPSIEWDNELGEIGRNINRLATDISDLIEQRVEDEKQKKDLEYQVLQSQINPHFLYNTLNSIKWMATAQHADGIAEMATALAHLMKSIAKGTTTIVSIKNEIQLLDDYFTIQKYRYGGAIRMEYQIDDSALLENQILRFTLQPIVENAIFHGIEPKGQSGQIDIHIWQNEERDVQIDITDNGVGMDEDTIRSVLSGETSSRSSFFRQIGIGSVDRRIRHTFGEKYGLHIKSEPGKYTCMTILLPERKIDLPDIH
ncbi:MAG TPA: sensor histidine kinase [Candidatus Mediterraneibacter norfolkensis]|nr:sensor histidine kinase [Candidatus Mediterraneibacter norfolkensis]